jgi:hypothetical protein
MKPVHAPVPATAQNEDSIFKKVGCKIIDLGKSLAHLVTGVGSKTASVSNPTLVGASTYLQQLTSLDKMKIFFAIVIVLIIASLLAFSLTAEAFSKAFGIILIVLLACALVAPALNNLFLRRELGSEVKNVSTPGYAGQILVMLFFVIAFAVYMYTDPLAKLTEYLSGYSIAAALVAFVLMIVLSYNNYVLSKYSGSLIAFIVFMTIIYFWNPFQFLTNHVDISTMTVVTIGTAIMIAMFLYQNNRFFLKAEELAYASSATAAPPDKEIQTALTYFSSIVLFILVLYSLISLSESYSDNKSFFSWILLFGIFFTMGAIAYKFIDKTNFIDKYPAVRLIINLILFLPCIYVNKIEMILKMAGIGKDDATKTPKSVWILLASELVLIALYLLYPYAHKYYQRKVYIGDNNQGVLLVNEPIDTGSETLVTSYNELNEPDELTSKLIPEYNYAVSLWFNIDAMPPSTGYQYNKFTSIFNFGEKPNIKYNASSNTLIVTTETGKDNEEMKRLIDNLRTTKGYDDVQVAQHLKEIGIELDEDDNRVVYKTNKLPMQRWNNMVFNYTGGTLDIFFNGELARSAIEIAPFLENDSMYVGTTNGISGGIGSLIYFKHTLTITEVHRTFDKFKNENPPNFVNDVGVNIKNK